ncbi:MAG: Crp/Fnr family transcriptional regulator, partial [Microcystaceae cyanobacterium]
MTYSVSEYQAFLKELEPFNQLPLGVLTDYGDRLQPWRYRMGQVIVMRGSASPYVFFLVKGQARYLGYDPRTGMPVTLQLLKPEAVMGAVSAIRGIPCETAIASDEAVCVALKQEEFLQLVKDYPVIQQAFQEQCGLVELFELLGEQLQQLAQGTVDLRELTLELMPQTEVYYLPPGRTKRKAHPQLQISEKQWLVSAGNLGLTPGQALPEDLNTLLEVKDGEPARLIGIPPLAAYLKSTEKTEE